MNIRIKHIVMVLGIASIIFSAQAAFARPYGGDTTEGRKEHGGERMKEMMRKLDLTSEQSDQIKQQKLESRETKKKLREALETKHRELRDELGKPNTDTGKVQVLAAEIKALMGLEVDNRIAGILRTKEVLTPAQFAEFQSLIKEKHSKMKKKKGSRHGGF